MGNFMHPRHQNLEKKTGNPWGNSPLKKKDTYPPEENRSFRLKVLCHTTHAAILTRKKLRGSPWDSFGRRLNFIQIEWNFKNLSKGWPQNLCINVLGYFFQLHLRMFPYKCPLSLCFYFASVLIFISKSGEGPLLVETLPSAPPMVVFLFEP